MAANEQVLRGLAVVRAVQSAMGGLSPTEVASSETATPRPPAAQITATGPTNDPTTAFVSWAHSHTSWSSEHTTEWESQVAAFAALLCRLGVDADVDLFHLDEPKDWTRYGPQQVEAAKFTLVVMSQAWAERWSGSNHPREGAGAAAEADTLKGLFTRNQELWQRRVVLVMFPEVGSGIVPPDLTYSALRECRSIPGILTHLTG